MRITDGLALRFVQSSMAAGRAAGYDPMLRIATGRQILRPVDDPVSADRIAQLDQRLAGLDRMNVARERLRTDLSLADSVLQAAADAVSDAHEMAIRMSNDSMGPDERAAAAQGVRDLIKRVSDLLNTQTADGRYLFAGTADDQPAYDTTTGAYLGSTGNRQVEIAPGTMVDGAINGDQLFGSPSDLLATLDAFATALETNDVTGIRDSIDNLEAQVHVVAQAQATVGFRLNGLDNAEDMVSQLELQWLGERSALKDVDLTTEITSLSAADTAYNAVLETSKRFLSMSLGRFL